MQGNFIERSNHKKELYPLCSANFLISCDEKPEAIYPIMEYSPSFTVNSNISVLSEHVKFTNIGSFNISSTVNAVSFNQVAEVTPNEINGMSLSATGVTVLNDKVYVTYHVRGENYSGEILTFDVANKITLYF